MKEKGARSHKYAAGQLVRIKSGEEISAGLDSAFERDGCAFMGPMGRWTGQIRAVKKLVYSCFDEFSQQMFRPRAPLYILEGLICEGDTGDFQPRCDRSCPLLWHEDWLEPPV